MRYFLKYNSSKEFVEMLYRITYVKRNDGTVFESLQYRTFAGLWFYSESYGDKISQFTASDYTKEVTKEEMDEYLKDNASKTD